MITNLSVARSLAQGKLVVSVNATRSAEDPFKLPPALLALIKADISALEIGDSGTHEQEGKRVESSTKARLAFDTLETALRAGYASIGALVSDSLLPTGISDADRIATYTTYGWEKGQLGRLNDDRLLVLGELAIQAETTLANPAWRYSPALTTVISEQLSLIEAEEPDAIGGARQVSVAIRNARRDVLQTHISRARYHYCAASDDLDSSKELAKISFQPRRAGIPAPPEAPPTPTPTPAPITTPAA